MKTIITTLALSLLSMTASAEFVGPGDQGQKTTVATALQSPDDTQVVLEGKIIRQINKDTYVFQDNTGTINVGIDQKRMPYEKITPSTSVRLIGEVDKD